MEPDPFTCFCGESFDGREGLIEHNVDTHGWSRDKSEQAVMEKYPRGV